MNRARIQKDSYFFWKIPQHKKLNLEFRIDGLAHIMYCGVYFAKRSSRKLSVTVVVFEDIHSCLID